MTLLHFARKPGISVVFFISELFLTSYCITVSLKDSSIHSVNKYNGGFFVKQLYLSIIIPITSLHQLTLLKKKQVHKEKKTHGQLLGVTWSFNLHLSDHMKESWPTSPSSLINIEILFSITTRIFKDRRTFRESCLKICLEWNGEWKRKFCFPIWCVTVWPDPAAGLEGEGSTLENEACYFCECWCLERTAAGRRHPSMSMASTAPSHLSPGFLMLSYMQRRQNSLLPGVKAPSPLPVLRHTLQERPTVPNHEP